jgi:hypothetical protein
VDVVVNGDGDVTEAPATADDVAVAVKDHGDDHGDDARRLPPDPPQVRCDCEEGGDDGDVKREAHGMADDAQRCHEDDRGDDDDR